MKWYSIFLVAVSAVAVTGDTFSQVVLSEIMFNPTGSESSDEFIEIVNLSDVDAVDLSEWEIGDGNGRDNIIVHLGGSTLQPGQFALILDPSYFGNSTSYDNFIASDALIITIDNSTFGSSGLSNSSSETVMLFEPSGTVVSERSYGLSGAAGFPEEKIDLFGDDSATNWRPGRVFLGTPGGPNSSTLAAPLSVDIKVNEIMYSPLAGEPEWLEVTNVGRLPLDLTRWGISDSDTSSRSFLERPLTLAPGDFLVLASDSSVADIFGVPDSSVRELSGFPSLNNDLDSIVLFDLLSRPVERVDYRRVWGGADGVSLEKIRPEFPSNDSSNWASSVAFATPGMRNSIFVETLPPTSTLSVSPDPFSPDADGRDDFTVISYDLPVATATVNLKVYDLRGRLIRFLVNNRPAAAHSSVTWNGEDDRGQVARVGIYVVFLQALNAQAGVLTAQKQAVVLAKQL